MAVTKLPIDDFFINTIARIDSGELMLKDAAAILGVTSPGLHKKIAKYKRMQPPDSLLAIASPAKRIFLEAKASGMGTKQSMRLAYPDAQESSLPVMASQIMAEDQSQIALSDLMARNSIGRNHRISVLARVINSPDLNIAVKGLDQSWKLDGSYAPDRLEVTNHINPQEALETLWRLGCIQRTDGVQPPIIETIASPA